MQIYVHRKVCNQDSPGECAAAPAKADNSRCLALHSSRTEYHCSQRLWPTFRTGTSPDSSYSRQQRETRRAGAARAAVSSAYRSQESSHPIADQSTSRPGRHARTWARACSHTHTVSCTTESQNSQLSSRLIGTHSDNSQLRHSIAVLWPALRLHVALSCRIDELLHKRAELCLPYSRVANAGALLFVQRVDGADTSHRRDVHYPGLRAEQRDQCVADPQGAEEVYPNSLERLHAEWYILAPPLAMATARNDRIECSDHGNILMARDPPVESSVRVHNVGI